MDQDRIDRMTRRARAEPVEPIMRSSRSDLEADAMIGKARLRRIVDRACTTEGPNLIATGTIRGRPLSDVLGGILTRSMPVSVTFERKDLTSIRMAYEALSPDERRDELDRHLWATTEPGRTRTCYSDLLDEMGIGR